jgi:carbonic anhydrase
VVCHSPQQLRNGILTDEVIRGLLSKGLETRALGAEGFYDVGKGPGSNQGA